MNVSVIIPTMPGREAMLQRLISTIPSTYQIVVVHDTDILLAAKRNKGALKATGEYLFFVDDDNYLEPGAIEEALEIAELPGVGVVGFMACYDDKKYSVADGGSKRNYLTGFTQGVNTNAHWPTLSKTSYEVDEVANAFMVHCETFYELQGFDEINFPIDLDEADFCKRAKDKGLKIIMCPEARCYHKSQTYSAMPDFRRPSNAYFLPRNKLNYQRKHLNVVSYWVHVIVFLPIHICVYTASLVWRGKFSLIPHFYSGVIDGLFCRRKNKYQKR